MQYTWKTAARDRLYDDITNDETVVKKLNKFFFKYANVSNFSPKK